MTSGSEAQHSFALRPIATAALVAALGIVSIVGPAPASAGDTGSAGGGQPIDTMQPSLGLTVFIAKDGVASGPGTGGSSGGGPVMAGEIRLFAGDIVPGGFLVADGSIIAISSAPNLFPVIGTTYGGDGVTTFGLPDLRGRAIAGLGQGPGLSPRNLGDKFGTETVTETIPQLPAHTHIVAGSATGSTGGGLPLPAIQPTIAMRPIINSGGFWPILSEIRLFAGNYDPGDWMTCDGRLLSIAQYDSLYQLIGTIYGGDGVSTFALPDLRGRVGIDEGMAPGGNPHAIGERFGVESNPLTSSQVVGHSHAVTNGSTSLTGSGASVGKLQPTLTIRYIFAFSGQFPSAGTTNTSSDPLMGEVRPYASPTLPNGWVFAEGQVVPINSNQALYQVTGGVFGGNGVTTFAYPDLRGRTPIGAGQGTGLTSRARGDRVGVETATITLSQTAAHTHLIDPGGLRHPGEPMGGGAVLRIAKSSSNPSNIDLTWGGGCATGVTGYAVYQGTLGAFSSHTLVGGACDIAATSLANQVPCDASCYYLVSAIDDLTGEEGSLGKRSTGAEIPRPAAPCAPAVDVAPCN